ncbi:MAG: hypothetical protein HY736_27675 [Verrucomicrobia bacterium]|nr:hypothetical protein [Verrucomicrobiota bacterium]
MPAQIDDPPPGSPVDPSCFLVRSWIWLGVEQSALTAVEAWCGDALPGETTTLDARADVPAPLALPAGARAVFNPATPRGAAQPDRAIRIDRQLK